MRADMFKVIVERPRWGASHAPPVKLKKDRDTDRKFIGLKRHAIEQAPYYKSLNENLAPLVRFIRKQVGRRWDDVFSEICAHLDTGSTVKMHVRTHLKDFVLFGISYGRHGELLHKGHPIEVDRRNFYWPEFYVDPEDGLLKDSVAFWRARGEERHGRRAAKRKNAQPQGNPDLRQINDTELLFRRNGCWFFYELDVRPRIDDDALREALSTGNWRYAGTWSVVRHHQLSKRELRWFGLRDEGTAA